MATRLSPLPILTILALALFWSVPMGNPFSYGHVVLAGEVVERDVFLFGSQITLDGIVHGNALLIGDRVTVNGRVDGSLILIGQNATIRGGVSGGVYSLALTLDLADLAHLQRDLYLAAVSLTSSPHSVIGRDLFAIGLDAGLNGQVQRDLHTVIGPIQLYNGLMHLLGFDELTLRLHFETPNGRGPRISPLGQGTGAGLVPMLKIHPIRLSVPPFDWSAWTVERLRLWGVLFFISLLALWLGRPLLDKSRRPIYARPAQTLAQGGGVLIAILNLYVLLVIIYVIFFTLGLGFAALGIWPLAVAIWLLTFCALLTLALVLWLFVLYGAKIVLCYAVFSSLLSRWNQVGGFWWSAFALLVGTLVYVLLRAIPYAGVLINLIVTAFGAGAVWLAWKQRDDLEARTRQLPDPVPGDR